MNPVLFLDRDGTILLEPNDYKISSFKKLRFLPFVITSLVTLKSIGYHLVMVSNQDGLGTEYLPWASFLPVHHLMLDILASEGILFEAVLIDTHYDHDDHPNRKPNTGMVLPWLAHKSIDLQRSFVIGDRKTDAHLAANLNCQSITIKCPLSYDGDHELQHYPSYPTVVFNDWRDITRFLQKKVQHHNNV